MKRAIVECSPEARPLLFVWLTSEPGDAGEYVEVAETLVSVDERNLAHLVVHRGMALFPESDSLSLFALRLELEARPKAA
jgi:hypothetical protein